MVVVNTLNDAKAVPITETGIIHVLEVNRYYLIKDRLDVTDTSIPHNTNGKFLEEVLKEISAVDNVDHTKIEWDETRKRLKQKVSPTSWVGADMAIPLKKDLTWNRIERIEKEELDTTANFDTLLDRGTFFIHSAPIMPSITNGPTIPEGCGLIYIIVERSDWASGNNTIVKQTVLYADADGDLDYVGRTMRALQLDSNGNINARTGWRKQSMGNEHWYYGNRKVLYDEVASGSTDYTGTNNILSISNVQPGWYFASIRVNARRKSSGDSAYCVVRLKVNGTTYRAPGQSQDYSAWNNVRYSGTAFDDYRGLTVNHFVYIEDRDSTVDVEVNFTEECRVNSGISVNSNIILHPLPFPLKPFGG